MSSVRCFKKHGGLLALLLWCAVLTATSCVDDSAEPPKSTKSNSTLTFSGRPELYGGDQHAWLTGAGDNADSNYCDARLKLPLEPEPTWEYSYTDAVFSAFPPEEIVHYDGTLVVSAYNSQLLGLDAKTGEMLFNQDVYFDSGKPRRSQKFETLFFHPLGLLGARDDHGRVYCWEIKDGNLNETWVYQGNGGVGGIVADNENFYTGGSNRIQGISAASGEVGLEYPTLISNTPILLSNSGLVVCWQYFRTKLIVFDKQNGHTEWVTFFDDFILSVVISEEWDCLYVTTSSDKLHCLDLNTGEQRWRYDFAWLVSQETRIERANLLNIVETKILPATPIVGPWGYCLPLSTGDVLLFSEHGELNWHYHADSSIVRAIGFNNAILVKQLWEPTESYVWPNLAPFNLTPPDWSEINATIDTRRRNSEDQGKPAMPLGQFTKIVALDIETGTELDTFEPEEYTSGSFIPAYNNIILGQIKGQREAGSRRGLPKLIVAFDWLAEGSD